MKPARIVMLAPLLALAGLSGTAAINGAPAAGRFPAPPANGELGFVVQKFHMPIVPGMDACPDGLSPTLREAYVQSLAPAERERLLRKENEDELARNWKALAAGPNGTNLCSQPDMFDRPLMKTVRASTAWGMDLDAGDPDGCAHEEFTGISGEKGVDNQEYRVFGCVPNARGRDGEGGEFEKGTHQFHASGEWTQVLLLKGVDSLENDPQVTVIYANTPDRPVQDAKGNFLPGASFTVSDAPPRNRNVLSGRIVNGTLITDPADIVLTQTWGQGGARDIRGNRTKFTFRKGRLRLSFRPDGTLGGLLGGYRPLFELFQSPALGGIGSPIVAGIDCASQLKTLRAMADGIRDPRTGQCTAVSSATLVEAVPAFVNDIPQRLAGARQ